MSDNRIWRHIGLRYRIASIAAFVVGAALFIAAGLLVNLLSRRLDATTTDAALLRAQDVGALATSGAVPTHLAFLGEKRALVQVVDDDGVVVASTDNVAGQPPITNRRSIDEKPLVLTVPVDEPEQASQFRVVSLNVLTGRGLHTIYAGEDLADDKQIVRAVTLLLAVVLPILVLLVAVITWWAAGRALRPVRLTTQTLAEITATDLHRRVPETLSRDEIGLLNSAINATLGRLDVAVSRQRRFVADASHELRGPLASLRADLEISVEHPDKTHWQTVASDTLTDVERLQQLSDDLLLLARLDANHTAATSTVDLAPIVAEVTSSKLCSGLEIRTVGADDAVVVSGSWSQLERLVRNLVDNAAAHADTMITATLESGTDTITLEISDDGPGIPANERARVFEPFVRLDTARTRDAGGTGLGLAIAHDIASSHGGTIDIRDAEPHGTTVAVSLPRAL